MGKRKSDSGAATALLRYRTAFDSAPIGYVALGDSDTITEINRGGAHVLGVTADQLLGMQFSAFVAPQSMGRFRALLALVRDTGATARAELQLLRAGVGVPVRMHATSLPTAVCTVMVAFEDISERIQKELELARIEHVLREEASRKDEFLAMLSHELRNPLAPIRTSVSVLEMLDLPSEAGRAAVDIIGRSSSQLARMVDELLDITRITRGKIVLRREVLDLNELVRRVLDEHGAMIEEYGLSTELRSSSDAIPVDGDPVRLVQVISNLLGNAANSRPPAGVSR